MKESGRINKERLKQLHGLMRALKYDFNDATLLDEALTHKSYAYENNLEYHNERLEFLGDSVLNIVITDYLYRHYKTLSEGNLSKLRARIVSKKPLSRLAKELGVGSYLLLSKGERITHGDTRVSTLADAMEAIIGAIYIDAGFDNVKDAILLLFKPFIKEALAETLNDYKSELQERLQVNGNVSIDYNIIKEEGPDHDKVFFVCVKVNGQMISQGHGKSKKEAEQDAARQALKILFNV